MAYFNGKRVFFSPRIHLVGGTSEEVIEVDSLPSESEATIGKVYKVTGTGELYCFLDADTFTPSDVVQTIASEGEAYETIGQLMGYDTCHILFTAKLEHSGEEFSCIVYTNSDYDPYSGRISSMMGTGDYGYGYDHMWCSSGQLCAGELYFYNLLSNAELPTYYSDGEGDHPVTIIITSITPLGQKLFDFSTGGKVNITTGKVE
jgi:hypothetical protein